MTEIRQWMDDCKIIHFTFNAKVEPIGKVHNFKIITKSDVPPHEPKGFLPGFYGYFSEDGISHCWIDLKDCKTVTNNPNDNILKNVFAFNRSAWISKKRKEKLENIIKECH